MDTKGLQKEFLSWCKSKNKSPKTEDETKQLFVAFMKEKHPEEYKQAVQNQQKQQQAQAQKAAHGAKLNYFKSLKNQCAEDEEVVYYKKGGSVGCGCKKKMEEGGQTPKKKNNAIDRFKNRKQDQATKDSIAVNNYGAEDIEATRPGTYKKNKEGKVQWTPDRTKAPYNKTPKKACGSKIKKHQEGSVIAQFKMHRQGGSLNGIPFMQEGTNKGGIRQSLSELIPLYGTYQIGKRFINNPSWSGAGELALSAVGDAAMLTGVGAGAGLALKAGNAAVKAGKIAKTANALRKVKAARNLKYGQPYAISGYYDDAAKTASNLAMDAAAYGGDYGKAVQQGSKLMRQASWADEAANTYNSAKWAAGNGAGIEAMTAFGRRQ